MIDRKIEQMLSCICCTKRNRNGVIALNAKELKSIVNKLTIREVLLLKSILGLTDSEAAVMFLGGIKYENIQI